MSQNQLSGCGQAHNASSHHSYVICAEKNKKQTDRTKFKVAINNRLAVQIEKVENKAEYLGQSPAMDEKETFDADQSGDL